MKRIHRGLAIIVSSLIFLSSAGIVHEAFAVQTTGGVNWVDPLSYQKPQFYPITLPDEDTCPNKYYVDLNSGTGSTCSQGSPCATLNAVVGKTGTNGGPAYIYLRGSGGINLYNVSLRGAAGTEVVIKPWAGATAAVSLKGKPNYIEGSNLSYLVFDGGPNKLFKFKGSSGYGEGNSNGFALNINSNYLTFYRCDFLVDGGTQGVGIARNSGNVTGTKFINSEFYDNLTPNGTAPLLYPGGGNVCSGSSTVNQTYIINCIFRKAGPEAIEFNPRTLSDGVYIYGSAFHDLGKLSCGNSWACRPAIVIDGPPCGGQTRNVYINNNLFWDTGSGAVWDRGGSSNIWIYNNTIYDYANGSGGGGVNPQGISGYTNGGHATIRNNIIYDSSGVNPIDGSSFVASNNICGNGETCGSAKQTYDTNIFLSINENDKNFLVLAGGSAAVGNGYNLSGNVAGSYNGVARVVPFDIGAFNSLSDNAAALSAPTALRVVE